VEGAEPGHVLQVDILDIKLRQDWGFNLIRPLSGTLPDEFPEGRILNIPLDAEKMIGRLPFGMNMPLKPFLPRYGCSAAETLGALHLGHSAQFWWQYRQLATCGGHNALFARSCSWPKFPVVMAMARRAMERFV